MRDDTVPELKLSVQRAAVDAMPGTSADGLEGLPCRVPYLTFGMLRRAPVLRIPAHHLCALLVPASPRCGVLARDVRHSLQHKQWLRQAGVKPSACGYSSHGEALDSQHPATVRLTTFGAFTDPLHKSRACTADWLALGAERSFREGKQSTVSCPEASSPWRSRFMLMQKRWLYVHRWPRSEG